MRCLTRDPKTSENDFVQSARLIAVVQLGSVLCHTVRELVPDDIDGDGEAVEQLPVAIAVDHLLAIPEGVVILPIVVYGGVQAQAVSINRVALVDIPVEVIGGTSALICFIDSWIADSRAALIPNQRAGQRCAICSSVYPPAFTSHLSRGEMNRCLG